jgi:hypothetical protein
MMEMIMKLIDVGGDDYEADVGDDDDDGGGGGGGGGGRHNQILTKMSMMMKIAMTMIMMTMVVIKTMMMFMTIMSMVMMMLIMMMINNFTHVNLKVASRWIGQSHGCYRFSEIKLKLFDAAVSALHMIMLKY